MKRSKALYETNDGTSDKIIPQDIYTYGYDRGRITVENSCDDFQDFHARNWSHGTCTCNRSVARCREINNYTTTLEQMQSKSFNKVGVGSVKTLKKRKVKKIYLPETEDRSTGMLDLSCYKNPDYQHFKSKKEHKRVTSGKSDKSVGNSFKKYSLHKELSPYVQAKLKYTNPQSIYLRKNITGKRLYNTFSIDNFINATTQINSAELGRARKIKIFKEREVNTETFENIKLDESESELSIDLSTVLSNKKDVSSVDSLVQHVYNLDKQRHNGNFSQISVDPMENILEREYRKMFSEQSRDYVFAKKSVSDSLLRRFEALRGSVSKNVPIRKISSQLTEPNAKDVSAVSDHLSHKSQSNVDRKIDIPPLTCDILKESLPEPPHASKKKTKNAKTRTLPKKPEAPVTENGNNGVKGKFKLWGKILSTETSLKKSKLKCCLKRKSLRSVKSSDKSEVKKERNKFSFFKKRDSTKTIKPKKAITAGRCEIREGLTLRIKKSSPRKSHDNAALRYMNENSEDDSPFYAWMNKLKFVDSWCSYLPTYLNLNNKSSSTTNNSNRTNILLYKNDGTNTMSLSRKRICPYTDFSRQYIQAWMIPNIILDGFGKTNIYCNFKCDKYNKRNEEKKTNNSLLSKQESEMTEGPYKIYKTIYVGNASVEGKFQSSSGCIMCDIGLECISKSKNDSGFHKESDEEVYNIVNYETPLPSVIASKKIALKHDITQNNTTAKQKIKQASTKPQRIGDNLTLLNNNISFQYNRKPVGKEMVMQQNADRISKRDHTGTNDVVDIAGFYPNAKKKLKYAEIYLRKFCHDCVPMHVNSVCSNSVVNLNQNMINSPQKDKNKNWKPNAKTQEDIMVSTIFSSCNAAAHISQEITKVKENFNGKKKDKATTDATIRIIPKDSLEVLKKRQLYFNSNKKNWNELSISVSSCTKHIDETQRSAKCHAKHVTISELGSTIQVKRSLLLKSDKKNEEEPQISEKQNKAANKNLIPVKKEEEKKTFCERGVMTEPSKDDNTTNKKKVEEVNKVHTTANMPVAPEGEVPQTPKEVTSRSSKIICVHNLPKKESKTKENIEDVGNLIEINLEVQHKQGEDKNIALADNSCDKKDTIEEKKKNAPDTKKKVINIVQNDLSKKIRCNNSNTYIKLRILVKNFNHNKDTTIKDPQKCEIPKQLPQKLPSTPTDKSINKNDNIRSVYHLNSMSSFANFNEKDVDKCDLNVTLLEEENKENSKMSEISCDCAVSSQNSLSKQSISFYGQEENIENHRLEINGGGTICENFQHSKIAFKTRGHLNPYKKFISSYKISNNKTKVICKHNEKYTSAQQAIQRMFECTQEVKKNNKRKQIKRPPGYARIANLNVISSYLKGERSRIERKTQTCKLRLHSLSSNSRAYDHFNSHLYSNQKSNIKFQNYYCEVVLTASKCHKSRNVICKCQRCLCKKITTTSGPSNLKSEDYPLILDHCGSESENTGQKISDHNIRQESCSSSSNMNNQGDGSQYKLKPILKTDRENIIDNSKSSKYNLEESSSIQKCNNEKIDVFELTEIKEAVLEMYAMEKSFCDSDLYTALPEFVSEVENNLQDSNINDNLQVLR